MGLKQTFLLISTSSVTHVINTSDYFYTNYRHFTFFTYLLPTAPACPRHIYRCWTRLWYRHHSDTTHTAAFTPHRHTPHHFHIYFYLDKFVSRLHTSKPTDFATILHVQWLATLLLSYTQSASLPPAVTKEDRSFRHCMSATVFCGTDFHENLNIKQLLETLLATYNALLECTTHNN